MTVIDLSGFNTQTEPMSAIEMVLTDYQQSFLDPKEALSIINAIAVEWRQ